MNLRQSVFFLSRCWKEQTNKITYTIFHTVQLIVVVVFFFLKSDNIESELLESEKKRFQVTIVPFVLERKNPKTKLHTQRENIKENIEWKLFLSIFTHNRYFSKFRTIYNNMLYTLSIYNKNCISYTITQQP